MLLIFELTLFYMQGLNLRPKNPQFFALPSELMYLSIISKLLWGRLESNQH